MLLIKHGTIIDGTGKPSYKKDILVSGNRIAAIGDFSGKKNIETIDALGGMVTPGFIDIHGTIDHHLSILTSPKQEHYLRQGVTSVIGGHYGESLAPLINGSLIGMRTWEDVDQLNVHWGSIKELRAHIEMRHPGINFGTLVGYETIRRALVGDTRRDLTDQELAMAIRGVTNALHEGALGVSIRHDTPHHERNAVVTLATHEGKLYSAYINPAYVGQQKALQETIAVTKKTGATTIISDWNIERGNEATASDGLLRINDLPKQTALYVVCDPGTTTFIPIEMLLPRARTQDIKRADRLTIVRAPKHEYLLGKTLESLAKNREATVEQTLFNIAELTNGNALVAWKNKNLRAQQTLMMEARTLIGGGDAAAIGEAPFTTYREQCDKQQQPIETTIAKITGIPAHLAKIKKRGKIEEGYFADLVIMHNNKIHDVVVNGTRAIHTEKIVAPNAGTVL